MQVTSKSAKRLNTKDLRKLENTGKILQCQGIIA